MDHSPVHGALSSPGQLSRHSTVSYLIPFFGPSLQRNGAERHDAGAARNDSQGYSQTRCSRMPSMPRTQGEVRCFAAWSGLHELQAGPCRVCGGTIKAKQDTVSRHLLPNISRYSTILGADRFAAVEAEGTRPDRECRKHDCHNLRVPSSTTRVVARLNAKPIKRRTWQHRNPSNL